MLKWNIHQIEWLYRCREHNQCWWDCWLHWIWKFHLHISAQKTKSYDNFKWNVNTNMTIWYVHNRLDQPKATIANQKRNKSLPLSSSSSSTVSPYIESFTRKACHPFDVKWMHMHVNALKLSHCWRLILYAIIISVISRAPPTVNGYNGAGVNGPSSSSKMLATASASIWPSNFFDADRIQCPSFVNNSACPCYKFEDGK